MFTEKENDLERYAEPETSTSMEESQRQAVWPDIDETLFYPTKQERRWVALGALKGALIIGAVYLIGAAVLIWLMIAFWT